MRIETAASIIDYFPGTKWANQQNSKHKPASDLLAEFSHEEIVAGCKKLKSLLSRSHISVDELAVEIRRIKAREAAQAKVWSDGINPDEVRRQRDAARDAVLAAPREAVEAAVARARTVGALDGNPLPGDRHRWTPFVIGIINAAMQMNEDDGA